MEISKIIRKNKKEPFLRLEYLYTDDSRPRNEYEIKKKIITEFEKLRSDSPGSINTINIDYAIEIVNRS